VDLCGRARAGWTLLEVVGERLLLGGGYVWGWAGVGWIVIGGWAFGLLGEVWRGVGIWIKLSNMSFATLVIVRLSSFPLYMGSEPSMGEIGEATGMIDS
jgi:hypothetical protein